MSGANAQNRFAPPRAEVDDSHDAEAGMVPAERGTRFLAALIDGLPTLVGVIGIIAAVAIPAYERYQQRHVPGIEPPPLGSSHHLLGSTAGVIGLALLAYLVYSTVLVFLYGQTFGKRVMGIRVVRTDGSRVAFSRFIFLRWLPVFIMRLIPFVGWVVPFLDPALIFRDSRRCMHDDIADTRVVTAASSTEATLRGDPKYASANLRTISF